MFICLNNVQSSILSILEEVIHNHQKNNGKTTKGGKKVFRVLKCSNEINKLLDRKTTIMFFPFGFLSPE
jgi:hypothetical protein